MVGDCIGRCRYAEWPVKDGIRKQTETSSSANKLLISFDLTKNFIIDWYNGHANSAEDIIQVRLSAFTKLLEELNSSHIQMVKLYVMLHDVIGEFAWQLRSRERAHCMLLGIYHKTDESFDQNSKPSLDLQKKTLLNGLGACYAARFFVKTQLASDPWYICVSSLAMIYQSFHEL